MPHGCYPYATRSRLPVLRSQSVAGFSSRDRRPPTGDRLVSIDGKPASDPSALSFSTPRPVEAGIARNGQAMSLRVEREAASTLLRRLGMEEIDGLIVPLGTSSEEVGYLKSFEARDISAVDIPGRTLSARLEPVLPRFRGVPFEGSWAGGRRRRRRTGQMRRSPIRRHDRLDGWYSRGEPHGGGTRGISGRVARGVSLVLVRLGKTRRCGVVLERADRILTSNGMQVLGGKHLPAAISATDLECALAREVRS